MEKISNELQLTFKGFKIKLKNLNDNLDGSDNTLIQMKSKKHELKEAVKENGININELNSTNEDIKNIKKKIKNLHCEIKFTKKTLKQLTTQHKKSIKAVSKKHITEYNKQVRKINKEIKNIFKEWEFYNPTSSLNTHDGEFPFWPDGNFPPMPDD